MWNSTQRRPSGWLLKGFNAVVLERNLISLYAPDSTTHCGSGEAISLNSMVPCALLALDCVAYAMALLSMRSIGERNCSAELL